MYVASRSEESVWVEECMYRREFSFARFVGGNGAVGVHRVHACE